MGRYCLSGKFPDEVLEKDKGQENAQAERVVHACSTLESRKGYLVSVVTLSLIIVFV